MSVPASASVSVSARGLSAHLLVDISVPKLPAVSPDGRRVAYLVSEAGEGGARHTDLWLAPVDGSGPATRLATGLARTTGLCWAPDGESLLSLVRGELRRTTLSGESEPLASHDAGILQCLPFPDGRRVAVITGGEESPEQERRAEEGDDAFVWGEHVPGDRLRIFDLDDSTWTQIDALGDRHVVAAALRPDGAAIAAISWSTALDDPGAFTARLHVIDADSGKARDLGPVGVDACSPVWWSEAGFWHVSYIAAAEGRIVGYAVFDVALSDGQVTGAGDAEPAHRDLTAGIAACPVELVQAGHAAPLAVFAESLDTGLYRLEPAELRFQKLLGRTGRLESLTVSRRGEVIAALASSGSDPDEIHAGPIAGPLNRISDARHALRDVEWGVQQRLSYQAADGLGLEGLFLLPPGASPEDGPFPLITVIHGGPYARHADAADLVLQPCPQWFAAAGYAVFLPNPRGSLGRGREFAASVLGALGQQEWTDILAGIDRLIADGVAHPDRLGITGWSHGGFLSSWAVGQSDRFKAAIVGAGISDWAVQVGAGELGGQDGALVGGYGWEGVGPHAHDRQSPISYASRIRTPVLLLHGEEDTNVPLCQAVYLERALRHYEVEHQLVVYPREGHGIWERAHQYDMLERAVAWFDRWIEKG